MDQAKPQNQSLPGQHGQCRDDPGDGRFVCLSDPGVFQIPGAGGAQLATDHAPHSRQSVRPAQSNRLVPPAAKKQSNVKSVGALVMTKNNWDSSESDHIDFEC